MEKLTLAWAAELYYIIGVLGQRIREHWNDGEAYNKRGRCYEELGKYEFALQDYSSAIEFMPYPHHYMARARLYLAMGRHAEYVADCEKAREQEKRLREYHTALALAARTEMEELLQKQSDDGH